MILFKRRYKSSWLYYALFKIMGVMLVGSLLFLVFELTDLEPDAFRHAKIDELIFGVLFVPLFLALIAYIAWRFAVVSAYADRLEIHRNGKTTAKQWSDVQGIAQVPFCTPPVYRIRFRDGEPPAFVCVFSWVTASIGFWSWDFTDFSDNIELFIESSEMAKEPPPAHDLPQQATGPADRS